MPARLKCRVHLASTEGSFPTVILEGVVVNVSERGMQLVALTPTDSDHRKVIRCLGRVILCDILGDAKNIQLSGEMVHFQIHGMDFPRNCEIGIRFSGPNAQDVGKVLAWLKGQHSA